MSVTVTESELLSFFEVEPRLTDPGEPWPYNSAAYATKVDRFEVLFSIAPAYPDFTLEVRDDGVIVFALTALGIQDVRYQKQAETESLEIVISDKHRVLLRLQPTLFIDQKVGFEALP